MKKTTLAIIFLLLICCTALTLTACSACGQPQSAGSTTYTRVDANGNPSASGKYILFGSYPQSEVTDSSLKSTLSSLAGSLPTSGNSRGWTSYKYYISESNSTDFMWYKDVTSGGERYRGVYFTSYRPDFTDYSSSSGSTYQDNNGYYTGNLYWFKYEPIKWRILEEKGGKAFLLCEQLIDSMEYYHDWDTNRTIGGRTVYPNNYEHSDIRRWLNDSFYNTAFSELQRQLIQLTTVDNSAQSTTDAGGNLTQATSYACANTQDYVFLLSEREVTTSAYGFASYGTYDTARQKKTTDYAQCQGAYTYRNGYWWFRSPYSSSDYARGVGNFGNASYGSSVSNTYVGVCPALWISLQ